MTDAPTFEEIFAVMSAASVGDMARRVPIPDEPRIDDLTTRFAIALNLLLDDLSLRTSALHAQVEALTKTQEQLRQSQKMEGIGRLAGGVAHDFNNLLSVILSYSSMLLEDLSPGDPLRADITEMHKAGERAATLTRQLLAFSRQQVLEPRVVDLNDVISAMGKMLERIIGDDVELSTMQDPMLGLVRVDVGQMEQILMNLAINARDALPTGGKLTIETRNVELDNNYALEHLSVVPGPYVMMAVSDTGVGMDKATQAQIFEPFFTTKERGKGTGLGLSTVFGIVKQSGGNIWVYSEPGGGTTFKVYFPRVDGIKDALEPAEPEHESGDKGATILVVEDEDQVRAVLCNILQRGGYQVLAAARGDEALTICQQHAKYIDLLLTDVMMPNMTGKQLAKRLETLRPEMKVLYISGYTDNSIVHHGILEAGIAFLQKPIMPDVLLKRVRGILASDSAS